MKTWAEVRDGKVWAVFLTDDEFVPEAARPIKFIEISHLETVPSAGTPLNDDGSIGEAKEEEKPAKKLPVLTKYQFAQRFSKEEWMAARKDPDFEYFYDLLSLCQEVDLNEPVIAQGLEAMIAKGHLAEGRKAGILKE